ncbi:MAG: DUF4905 domain-containing protein [Bacteroidia bacterium]|nr:DUF4905 domain-containing protein [Bacteroidia bacterium]
MNFIEIPFPNELVWRILHDRHTGYLAIELRNYDQKKVRFVCLNPEKSSPLISSITELPDSWWCGIEESYQGRILLHGYRNPSLPEHLGIYAYDVNTGQCVWKQPELTYYRTIKEGFLAIQTQSEKLYLLEPLSGELIRTITPQERSVWMQKVSEFMEISYQFIQLPESLAPDDPGYSFYNEKINYQAQVGPIDYLQRGDYEIIGYYQLHTDIGFFNHHIAVLYQQQILQQFEIANRVPSWAVDPFSIIQNTLVFVNQKKIVLGEF